MSSAVTVVLVIALAVGFPIVVYLAVQSETQTTPVMDRDAAERSARSDSGRRTRTDGRDEQKSRDR